LRHTWNRRRGGRPAPDEIVAIDGVGFGQYGVAKLFDRVHTAGPMQLTIRRDGSERAVQLRLRPVL